MLTFLFNIGLETVLKKVGGEEVDPEIRIKTEEKEGVLLVRKKGTKLETVKNPEVEEEVDLDLDLILEKEEDPAEETQETEETDDQDPDLQNQDHLIHGNVEVAETIANLQVTEEETIEATRDLCPTAKTVEKIDVLPEETQETGSQLVNLGLVEKKVKEVNTVSEKVSTL